MLYGSFVEIVPLDNFKRLVPARASQLCYVNLTSESDDPHWKFYTYDAHELLSSYVIKHFARWIIHRDLGSLATTVSDNDEIYDALERCSLVRENDYQDELLDTWMSWLLDGVYPGDLNIDRLRRGGHKDLSGDVFDLMCALVIWHDGEARFVESELDLHYSSRIRERVLKLPKLVFINKEPKNPLELSDKQFCRTYHAHNDSNSPCYKEKRASKDV
jgi:hypothetical protein